MRFKSMSAGTPGAAAADGVSTTTAEMLPGNPEGWKFVVCA
jgi:hypothetical protein